jgi:hypothetical protein
MRFVIMGSPPCGAARRSSFGAFEDSSTWLSKPRAVAAKEREDTESIHSFEASRTDSDRYREHCFGGRATFASPSAVALVAEVATARLSCPGSVR